MKIKSTRSKLVKYYLASALFFSGSGYTGYKSYESMTAFNELFSGQYSQVLNERNLVRDTLSFGGYCTLRNLAEASDLDETVSYGKKLLSREKTLELKLDSLGPSISERNKVGGNVYYGMILALGLFGGIFSFLLGKGTFKSDKDLKH